MPVLGINDFKAKLIGGGARNNLFQVTCNFPSFAGGPSDTELASFLIKSAQLPSSIVAPITISFRGRQLPIAGDRTFEPWGITVINDNNMQLRNIFEAWVNNINDNATNTGFIDPSDYSVDMIVQQLDKAGNFTKTYNMRGVWPSHISGIDLNYDASNSIEEFGVELQVLYWDSPESDISGQ